MDKKNTTIGVILLIAAFGAYFYGLKTQPPAPAPAPVVEQTTSTTPAAAATTTTQQQPTLSAAPAGTFAALAKENDAAQVVTLANDFIEARFTNFGGAIKDVEIKKYAEKLDPVTHKPVGTYVINHLHSDPALSIVGFPGLDRDARYELVSQSPTEVVYRTVFENRIEVTRRYQLQATAKENDPYRIRHETTLRNLTNETIPLPRIALSVGTAAPVNATDSGMYLTTGYKTGSDYKFTKRDSLQGGNGFFGLGASVTKEQIETTAPIAWASVSNQFFTSIYTPDQAAISEVTRRVDLGLFAGTTTSAIGISSAARFEMAPLAGKAEAKLTGLFYAGPKEYSRLSGTSAFKQDEDKVMDFGYFFGWASQILSSLMSGIHKLVPNWGLSIILTTLTIKIIFIPLTLSAARSMKRMQKYQPEVKAIQDKFKDNPQKAQMAVMAFYKEKKINMLGGCIPMLLPMPFFIGFFNMLPGTAELRFQSFLWAHDLSAPDTVAHIYGIPLNILPIILGATMIFQMRLTPQSTAMSESAQTQMKMMKFMPYFFAFICYGYSCALSLYSTINGLFTIGQQLIINRMKDPEEPVTVQPSGKKIKNVTPKK